MALPDETLQELRALLKECAAEVLAPSGARGSGFFVDAEHVLTCAHVVKGPLGGKVKVKPNGAGRQEREGEIVEFEDGPDADLALVKVDPVDSEPPQPAVVLDRHLDDNEPYYAVGWPKPDIIGVGGIEELQYKGHSSGGESLLILDAGTNVTEGLSGGAVLSSATGAVVALVQYSRQRDVPNGGGAIPVARAADRFAIVATHVANPPPPTQRWKASLGPDAWSALKKPASWHSAVNVVVVGTRDKWSVRIDGGDPVDVANLPERVSHALFYWAQRRHIQEKADVKLLGQLLAGAVFPAGVAQQIAGIGGGDELRVRLTVEDEKLFDVPWEFVTLGAADETHVAADAALRFVRVVSHTTPEAVTPVPRQPGDGDAPILGIAVQPEMWQKRMNKFRADETGWPAAGAVVKQLEDAVNHANQAAKHLTFAALENPAPAEVERKLAEAKLKSRNERPEVVHYVGFGGTIAGEAKIAFSNGEGGVQWTRAAEFVRWVADSGARVLVMQFSPPPFGQTLEFVAPSAFREALAKRLNAIVVTRFPMLLGHLSGFNRAFYSALAQGRSVETAVQLGRRDVFVNELYGDAGAFGSFTLITGEQGEMRLLPAAVSTPFDGAKQAGPIEREERVPAGAGVERDTFGQ